MQPITFQWKTRRLLLDGYWVEGLMPQRMEAFFFFIGGSVIFAPASR